MCSKRRADALVFLILVTFMGVGAYLRLANLRVNPGWYPDEGSDLNIAWNLWHGRVQYFAVGGSLLVAARAPLFHLILAGLFNLFGYDMLIARSVGALAGLATIPLLFFSLKRSLGRWQALGAAGLFAVFPLAVLYNRWAFAYNLLMPLSLLEFWALLHLMESGHARWMIVAALVTAVSILTAWVCLSLVICLIVVAWLYQRRTLVWGLPLAISLPAVYLALSYAYAPAALLQDMGLTFFRTGGSIPAQFVYTVANYSIFIASNFWFALGIIGLFMVETRRVRALVLLIFFVVLFSVLRFAYVAEFGFYRLLELVPFLVIGLTTFLWRGVPFVIQLVAADLDRINDRLQLSQGMASWSRRILKATLIPIFVYLLFVGILFTSVIYDLLSVDSGFATRIDEVLAVPTSDAAAVVGYVNGKANPDDVVLSSPQLGWALRAEAVDFQQALSYEGFATDNYPIPIQRDRFIFDPSPENASYAIVDPMWRIWAVKNIPAMKGMLSSVQNWPIAFKSGDFVVYKNPRR